MQCSSIRTIRSWRPSFNDALKNTRAVLAQSLFNILNNILNSFDSNAEADHTRRDSAQTLLLFVHLRMSGSLRVDSKRFGIANIRNMAHELEAINEFLPRLGPSLHFKDNKRATLSAQVLQIFLVLWIVLQARVAGPFHFWVALL
jgi:hypothetical protein